MKRKLKIAGVAVLALIVLLVGFLAWVIYTEAGLRFAVSALPAKLGKSQTELVITNVSGTIARGFSAERVDVRHEISEVLQLASAIAIHTCTYAVPGLTDAVKELAKPSP